MPNPKDWIAEAAKEFSIGDEVEMTKRGVNSAGLNWLGSRGIVMDITPKKIRVKSGEVVMRWPKSFWEKTSSAAPKLIQGTPVELSRHAIDQGCTVDVLGSNWGEIVEVLHNGMIKVSVLGGSTVTHHPDFWVPRKDARAAAPAPVIPSPSVPEVVSDARAGEIVNDWKAESIKKSVCAQIRGEADTPEREVELIDIILGLLRDRAARVAEAAAKDELITAIFDRCRIVLGHGDSFLIDHCKRDGRDHRDILIEMLSPSFAEQLADALDPPVNAGEGR